MANGTSDHTIKMMLEELELLSKSNRNHNCNNNHVMAGLTEKSSFLCVEKPIDTTGRLNDKDVLQLVANAYPEKPTVSYLGKNYKLIDNCIRPNIKSAYHLIDNDGKRFVTHDVWPAIADTYITRDQYLNWLCLEGYKGYQVKLISVKEWAMPPRSIASESMKDYELRRVSVHDREIVYGEPHKFTVDSIGRLFTN